ncbi:MAG: hypothetical protein R3B70_10615 [Polyangiaceae bacterium]
MPSPSDPRNLRAKWQRALEERRKAGAETPPLDVTPGKPARDTSAGNAPSPRDASADTPASDASPRDASASTSRETSTSTTAASTTAASTTAASTTAASTTAASSTSASTTAAGDAKKKPVGPRAASDDEAEKKASSSSSSPWGSILAALVFVGGIGFALRTFITPGDPDDDDDDIPAPALTAPEPGGSAVPSALPEAVGPARCAAPGDKPFVIGDAPAARPASSANEGDDARGDGELQPFAVELGRGVWSDKRFAIGAQVPGEGGSVAMVATLDESGKGNLVRLARSRGDFDPPVLAASGGTLLSAMMEPNAGGRAIRIAKIEGDRVTWGPELSEGNDESTAVDLAMSEGRGIVVWDDVPLGRERSVIQLATFDLGTMQGSGARPITPPSIDADGPRLAPRPGGYWLAYLAHGDPPTAPTASKDDGDTPGDPKKPGSKSKADDNPDDSDTEAAGEALGHQWIELVPLDASGLATGAARAVTPQSARVIGFDLSASADGRATLIYRDDDTPTGSTGGRVAVVTAELGGIGEARVIAEDGVGTGVPQLFGDWVVIHSLTGPIQLGFLGAQGDLAGALAPEKELKLGEILGAHETTFLVATPAGRAMKLGVATCKR